MARPGEARALSELAHKLLDTPQPGTSRRSHTSRLTCTCDAVAGASNECGHLDCPRLALTSPREFWPRLGGDRGGVVERRVVANCRATLGSDPGVGAARAEVREWPGRGWSCSSRSGRNRRAEGPSIRPACICGHQRSTASARASMGSSRPSWPRMCRWPTSIGGSVHVTAVAETASHRSGVCAGRRAYGMRSGWRQAALRTGREPSSRAPARAAGR